MSRIADVYNLPSAEEAKKRSVARKKKKAEHDRCVHGRLSGFGRALFANVCFCGFFLLMSVLEKTNGWRTAYPYFLLPIILVALLVAFLCLFNHKLKPYAEGVILCCGIVLAVLIFLYGAELLPAYNEVFQYLKLPKGGI
ncbi:MAG: hypothetical protein WCI30_09950 [Clostridia bacterium]